MKHYLQFFTLTTALVINCLTTNAQLWPGDVNNNGEVTSFDLLYLGFAYGAQGAVRPNASTNWLAQTAAPSWGASFPSNSNDISFADCNGDGVVDDLDILVIEQNYHLTHTVVPDQLIPGTPGLDPSVEVKRTTSDTLMAGATELFEIHLGPGHISDFYGISFTIAYDTANVDSFLQVLPATGWITNNGQDKVIQVAKNYIRPNSVNGKDGRIDISYSRTNGQSVMGSGIVGLFAIVMEDNVNGKKSSAIDIEMEVIDIRMADPLLNLSPTVPSISNFVLVQDSSILLNTELQIISEEKDFLIYPNPASASCTVSNEELTFNRLEVISMNGVVLQVYQFRETHVYSVELNHLPKGIYILKLKTEKGIILKKLVLSG